MGQFAKKTALTLGLCMVMSFPAFAGESARHIELKSSQVTETKLVSVLERKGAPDMSETQAKQRISLDQAKKIALKHAGVSASEATFIKARRDWDDGRVEYEIEFVANGRKYEYEILASNGRIIKSEVESINDDGYDD